MSVTGGKGVGIPIILLHDSVGGTVHLELKNGDSYRGILKEAQDNMNCTLKNCKKRTHAGIESEIQEVFIRGSQLAYIVIPEMLGRGPIFKRINTFRTFKGHAMVGGATANKGAMDMGGMGGRGGFGGGGGGVGGGGGALGGGGAVALAGDVGEAEGVAITAHARPPRNYIHSFYVVLINMIQFKPTHLYTYHISSWLHQHIHLHTSTQVPQVLLRYLSPLARSITPGRNCTCRGPGTHHLLGRHWAAEG